MAQLALYLVSAPSGPLAVPSQVQVPLDFLKRSFSGAGLGEPKHVATEEDVLRCRKLAASVYMDDRVLDYIVNLVAATRDPAAAGLKDLAPLIEYGASPRTSISLARAAKAHALLRGRAYVTPEDVKAVGMDVMRHRVLLTYEAEAEDARAEHVVQRVFDKVEVP